MIAKHLLAALLLGTTLGGAGAASPGNTEHASFEPVFLDGGIGFRRPEAPALLSLPQGWLSGDAIVVLTPDEGWPPGQRDRLVAAVLDTGAGVLEMSRPRRARPADDIVAAIRVLRASHGPGLMVVMGHGEAGEAALAVAGEMQAAAIRLGPVQPAFSLAGAPALFDFPQRPALLCDLLAAAWVAGEPDIAGGCHAAVAALR